MEKDNRTKVSIVMPVYNASNYLDRSLSDIVNQTYSNLEIIIVDDYSQDDSKSVYLKYAAHDSRIKIFVQKSNMGAASARNRGLEYATGEYIIFLDADDSFDREMIRKSLDAAVNNHADVVVFGYHEIIIAENDTHIIHKLNKEVYQTCDDKLELMNKCMTVPWNKLVRREVLLHNNIFFQNIPSENDVFYSYATILTSDTVVTLGDVLVQYYHGHANSISCDRDKKCSHLVLAQEAVYQYIVETMGNQQLAISYLNEVISSVLYRLQNEKNKRKLNAACEQWGNSRIFHNAILENQDNIHISSSNRLFIQRMLSGEDWKIDNIYLLYKDDIKETLEHIHQNNKKIALWGYGKRGKQFLKMLIDENIGIDFIIDNDINKIGNIVDRYTIVRYETIAHNVDYVIVLSEIIKNEIINKIDAQKIIEIII